MKGIYSYRVFFISLSIIIGLTNAKAADQTTFLNALGEKKQTTVEDAVTLYVYLLGKNPAAFASNVDLLKKESILKPKKNYQPDTRLRKGLLAGMIARHLKLNDSLMYLVFRTDRYAHRACIADAIMEVEGSEWDPISGDQLIEIIGIVSSRMEDSK